MRLWCEHAWLGGETAAAGVALTIEDGRFVDVRAGVERQGVRLAGLTLPGLANAHSHTFQRALRGRAQRGEGSFWTWREEMYALAATLDPDRVFALARATFGEMALAGVTGVGEFHYVHHAADGTPYEDANATGHAVIAAAAAAGIRLTLLDACYLDGGLPAFRDADADAWASRVAAIAPGTARVGAAIHSVRAVPPRAAATVAAAAAGRPLHAHVSEQPAENRWCAERHGQTPAGVLAQAGALGPDFTAVHATHLADADVALLAAGHVCLCPTTERDLADGVGPARRLRDAGARLATGSDSHAVVDPFEEARAIELDERLQSGVRGRHSPAELLAAATNHACLGWPEAGRIAPGALADMVTVDLGSVRTLGTEPLAGAVFAATAGDVRDVMVGGEWLVRDRAHVRLDVRAELERAL